MDQRINLYDEYAQKPLLRQKFLNRLVALTGSAAATLNVLPLPESCGRAAKITFKLVWKRTLDFFDKYLG